MAIQPFGKTKLTKVLQFTNVKYLSFRDLDAQKVGGSLISADPNFLPLESLIQPVSSK